MDRVNNSLDIVLARAEVLRESLTHQRRNGRLLRDLKFDQQRGEATCGSSWHSVRLVVLRLPQ